MVYCLKGLNRGSISPAYKTKKDKIQKERKEMKGFKTLLTGILAATMIMGSCITASAETTTTAYSITVQNANKGQTYKAYKLFDATTTKDMKESSAAEAKNKDGITYTLPSGKSLSDEYTYTGSNGEEVKVKGSDWFTVDNAGYIGVKEGITDSNLATENFRQWAKQFGTKVGELTPQSEGQEVAFSDLSEGYYFISTTTGSLASVTSIAPNQQVEDKNGTPSVDKEEDQATNDVTDIVAYTVTVHLVPGTQNVIFHDRLTKGLTLQGSAPTITMSGAAFDAANYTLTKYENVEDDAEDDIVITFSQAYLDSITENRDVVISYTAKVNENAVVNEHNDAKLRYGENNDIDSETKTVYQSTFGFSVNKVDGAGAALNGAKFVLSKESDLGNLTTDLTDAQKAKLLKFNGSAGTYNYDVNGSVYVLDADNSIAVDGLDGDANGVQYFLYEVKAPEGYNKLTAPVKVIITPTFDSANTTKVNSYKVTYTINNETKDCTATGITDIHQFDVQNTKGTLLPSTGGMGTTVFYIVGAILIIAGVAYFIVRRKADAE